MPVAGISCESCHGAGEDWIKLHSQYSGKTEKTEQLKKYLATFPNLILTDYVEFRWHIGGRLK